MNITTTELRRRIAAHREAIAEAARQEAARYAALPLNDIDLSRVWEDLDEDERDYLVAAGAVEEIEASVECTDAEPWWYAWFPECKAAWPCYTLHIEAEGMPPLEITGWRRVGPMPPADKWDVSDSDGVYSGQCRVAAWQIHSGDNVGTSHTIPVWRHHGRWCTLDRDALQAAIAAAATGADHGDEPTWKDVARDQHQMVTCDTRYIVREGQVVKVDILTGGLRYYVEGYRHAYHAAAWSHSLTHSTWETEAEALADLRERADDALTWEDESEAIASLARAAGQQVNLDRIIAETDPYVSVADSLAAGNCRQVTEQVRQQLTERLGATGEIGGVRASVLLALRDDMYSRRACHMAALRMLSQH